MIWINDKAVGNDGKAHATVEAFPRIEGTHVGKVGDTVLGPYFDAANARRACEKHLLRRNFRHEWKLNELHVNGVAVGHYELYGDSATNIGFCHGKRIFNPVARSLKAAMVAEAKRQYLNKL